MRLCRRNWLSCARYVLARVRLRQPALIACNTQAETSIREELTERSQTSRLKVELSAEQSRAAEATDVAERLAVQLEVRGSSLEAVRHELTPSCRLHKPRSALYSRSSLN